VGGPPHPRLCRYRSPDQPRCRSPDRIRPPCLPLHRHRRRGPLRPDRRRNRPLLPPRGRSRPPVPEPPGPRRRRVAPRPAAPLLSRSEWARPAGAPLRRSLVPIGVGREAKYTPALPPRHLRRRPALPPPADPPRSVRGQNRDATAAAAAQRPAHAAGSRSGLRWHGAWGVARRGRSGTCGTGSPRQGLVAPRGRRSRYSRTRCGMRRAGGGARPSPALPRPPREAVHGEVTASPASPQE